jgi:hypothetical protein
MLFFRKSSHQRYGQTFRAANLLSDIHRFVPRARFLIIVRDPESYALSAHFKRVMRKGGQWDDYRLLPPLSGTEPLSDRLAQHWVTVNDYLLDFAEAVHCPVLIFQPLTQIVEQITNKLGVEILDRNGLNELLDRKPNASMNHDEPQGWRPERVQTIAKATWLRAQQLASS